MNSGWVNAVQNLRCQAITQAGQYDGLWLAQARTQFHIFIHPTAVHRSQALVMILFKSVSNWLSLVMLARLRYCRKVTHL